MAERDNSTLLSMQGEGALPTNDGLSSLVQTRFADAPRDDPLVIELLEHIRQTHGFNLRVSELAARYRVTVRTLENRCRKALGRSAGDILREACLESVRALVVETDRPFAEIAHTCGQLSAAHLAAMFRRQNGMSMREWRGSLTADSR